MSVNIYRTIWHYIPEVAQHVAGLDANGKPQFRLLELRGWRGIGIGVISKRKEVILNLDMTSKLRE
jgi:hypothetical protein